MTRRSSRRPAVSSRAARNPFARVAIEQLEDRVTPALFNPLPVASSSFNNASWAALGKFNNDNNLDMAVASYSGNAVTVMMGNGNGTFGTAVSYPVGGTETNFLDVGDLNGDGYDDIVATVLNNTGQTSANPGQIQVLICDGNGGFTPATGAPFDSNGRKPYAVVVGNFVGDASLDLAVCHFGIPQGTDSFQGNNVTIFQGKGNGTFTLGQTITNGIGFNPLSIAAGDFDGDGDLDLVVTEAGIPANTGDPPINGSVTVLTNTSGTFALTAEYDSLGHNPVNVRVADMTGDGKPDIVVANTGDTDLLGLPSGANDSVAVLINGGTGSFANAKSFTSDLFSAFAVAPADFDGDGKGDVAVANYGSLGDAFMSAHIGDGAGNFTAASGSPYMSSGIIGGQVVVAGDLNNDGTQDVVLLGAATSYRVYLNTSVPPVATTTTLGVAPASPSTFGDAVTMTATVAATSGTPTGTVTFLNGSVVIGSAPLAAVGGQQVATLTFADPTFLNAGSYNLTARYEGANGFNKSTSPATPYTVNKAATTTTMTVAPANPVMVGAGVTFTVTVAGTGAPTGPVVLYKGASVLGQANLAANGGQQKAVFNIPTVGWTAGDYTITAKYAANANWLGDDSDPYTLTLSNAPAVSTTTTVSSVLPNPALATQTVTITAVVAAASGTPTGSVRFFVDGTPIGDSNLSAVGGQQVATITTSALGLGGHVVTAGYLGQAGSFDPSTSGPANLTVNPIGTTISVSSSGNPSFVTQPVTFTALVGSQLGAATGTVTFWDGGVQIGSGNLTTVGGQQVATFTGPLGEGSHTITAKFAAQGNFAAIDSAPITQTVNKVGTATTISTSLNPVPEGQAITLTANVAGLAAIGVAPAGTVTFLDSGTVIGTGTLTGNAATFTTTLAPGTHSITAAFAGDANYTASTSAALSVVVNPTVPPPPPPGPAPDLSREFGVGAGAGHDAEARFFNPDGTERFSMNLFPGFTGGVRVTSADFNGDGVADLVAGTGPGQASAVVVLDGKTKAELFRTAPFEAAFVGGVYVAAGDVNGDGTPDLVVSPDEGGGPRVQVYSGADAKFAKLDDFFGIDDTNFRGGARAAVGDINGDGVGDLVVAAGFGGGPRVAVFNGKTLGGGDRVKLFADFFAFEPALRNGAFVAAGDVDGDGFADLIAGGGPGGGPRVTVYSGERLMGNQQVPVANFFGGNTDNRGGVRVTAKDLDGDALADLVIGDGTGAGSRVTAYAGKTLRSASPPPTLFSFDAFPGFDGGVYVG
jgi:hypothetical protein